MPILEAKRDRSAFRGILHAICHAFFRRRQHSADQPHIETAHPEPRGTKVIRKRMAEEAKRLESLDAERERRGDAHFGMTAEDRIVWGELIELELQEIDEKVSRLRGAAGGAEEELMNATTHEPLNLNSEERELLAELLESERAKLLIEIRHTHHRSFRDELRQRLAVVEELEARCHAE